MSMPSGNFKEMDRKELVGKLRNALKGEKVIQEILKKYELDDSVLDHLSIRFEPLDVSAKTVDGNIILNENLLDCEWRDIMRYLVHETCHVGQQATSDVTETQDGDYLDDENEVEAFQTQIDYMEGDGHDEMVYCPEEIQQYIDDLMDHHGLRGKERRKKIEELLE